jgi:glycosyltransferase involved in cell wall biosynthesis
MRILVLTDVFFPDTIGGAGRVASRLSYELNEKGHEVHTLARNPGGSLPIFEQMGANHFVHRFFVPMKEGLALPLTEIRNSFIAAQKISRQVYFDLLCTHQTLIVLGPLLSRRLRRIPFVYFFHSPWHEEYLTKKQVHTGISGRCIASAMKRAESRVLRRASKVIVLSQFMAHKIHEIHHFPEQKIAKIPGGVDLQRFRPPKEAKQRAKELAHFPSGRMTFLTVRNLVPRMGLENLVEAFNKSETLRGRALLVICGDGPLMQKLESLIDRSHLEDSIRLAGRVEEKQLPRFYQGADFFVLPTKELEGFGLVILEAMACGTPVLGTPVGAIPETIGAFDKKLLFDGAEWPDIREKLEEIVQKPERYRFAPEECRKFVETNFSWKKMACAFEKAAAEVVPKMREQVSCFSAFR